MPKQTVIEVIETRMALLCKQQDFEAAANVRNIKRAMEDNNVLLTEEQALVVESFLDIVAHKK